MCIRDRFNVPGSTGTFAKMGHNTASGTNMLDIRSEGHTRFLTNGNNESMRITNGNDVIIGGDSIGDSGSFGVQSSGAFRSILAASTASDTLLGAISGVSNGFQVNITDANAMTYTFHTGSQVSQRINSSGAILHYLSETNHNKLSHITNIRRVFEDDYVWMDRFTIRNLELFSSPNEGAKTLIDILDECVSPMGARLLKRWLALPLKDEKRIKKRLQVVEYLIQNEEFSSLIHQQISQIGDLERIISKVATGRISPRECLQLKVALQALKPIKEACKNSSDKTFALPCLKATSFLLNLRRNGCTKADTPSTKGTIRSGTRPKGPAMLKITPMKRNINGKSIKLSLIHISEPTRPY